MPAGMAQRRREHVELEQLAVAVGHLDGLLPVELQLQPRRRLEARMRLRAAGCPDGDAVLAHELGEVEHRESFANARELQAKLSDYVHWHNNFRIHSTLGYMSPVEFRKAGLAL